jgi:hypothetical protein
MRLLLASLALLSACGSGETSNLQGNGAAAPPPGQPDNRIECQPAGAAAFARACTVDSAESREGRILTIRKADGGFRRLLIDRAGNVWAADGAEQVNLLRTDDREEVPIEVEIGGDRFRLGPQWGVRVPLEPTRP